MKTITVKLDDPIKVDGKDTDTVTLRKPTVRELRASKVRGGDDAMERTLVMIGDIATLSPDQVDQLSLTDLDKINQEMVKENFIPADRTAPKS